MKKQFVSLLAILIFLTSCNDDDSNSDDGVLVSDPDIAVRAFDLINEYRASQGLTPLVWNDEVAEVCAIHSGDMANGNVAFGHDGFDDRISALRNSLSFGGSAENVASNQGNSDPAEVAVNSWLNSPGHLENIEGNYDLSAIAAAEREDGTFFFTQIFLRSN